MLEVALIAVVLLLYPFALYPMLLAIAGRITNRSRLDTPRSLAPTPGKSLEKSVSVVIAVHNEQRQLRAKIVDMLDAFRRVCKDVEYLVVDDGSTDESRAIIDEFSDVCSIRLERQRGKEFAVQRAIAKASHPILVFTDAAARFEESSIRALLVRLDDPMIGCVSSRDSIRPPASLANRAFVELEMYIRMWESRLGSCVGVSGSLFAARREFCTDLDSRQCSDLQVPFECVRRGYRSVIEPEAVASYREARDFREEFRRKERTIAQGILTLLRNLDLLNPWSHPVFAWQVVSHKLLRWLAAPMLCFSCALAGLIAVADFANRPIAVLFFLAGTVLVSSRAPHGLCLRNPAYIAACTIAVPRAVWAILYRRDHRRWLPTRR